MVPHDIVPGLCPVHSLDEHHQCTGDGGGEPIGFEAWTCGLGSTVRSVGSHGSAISYSHQCGRLILN